MALFEIGMTQEQVMEAINPAPKDRYRLGYEGLMLDKENGGDPRWTTKRGGKMVKALLRIISPDPIQHGKSIIYNGVIGSFSFANLTAVLPLMSGTGIDPEAGKGMEIEADVDVDTYTKNDGTEGKRNNIVKMYSIG